MANQHVRTAADAKGNNSPNVTVACMWEAGTKQMLFNTKHVKNIIFANNHAKCLDMFILFRCKGRWN